MSLFVILSQVAHQIERLQRNFLRTGGDDDRRLHPVAWDQLSTPKSKGGLGLRRLYIGRFFSIGCEGLG